MGPVQGRICCRKMSRKRHQCTMFIRVWHEESANCAKMTITYNLPTFSGFPPLVAIFQPPQTTVFPSISFSMAWFSFALLSITSFSHSFSTCCLSKSHKSHNHPNLISQMSHYCFWLMLCLLIMCMDKNLGHHPWPFTTIHHSSPLFVGHPPIND